MLENYILDTAFSDKPSYNFSPHSWEHLTYSVGTLIRELHKKLNVQTLFMVSVKSCQHYFRHAAKCSNSFLEIKYFYQSCPSEFTYSQITLPPRFTSCPAEIQITKMLVTIAAHSLLCFLWGLTHQNQFSLKEDLSVPLNQQLSSFLLFLWLFLLQSKAILGLLQNCLPIKSLLCFLDSHPILQCMHSMQQEDVAILQN